MHKCLWMRKCLWISALVLLIAGAAGTVGAEPLKNKIGLTYSLVLQNGLTTANILDGFESGDRFRLQVRPGQAVYAYVAVESRPGEFQLVYPHRESQRGRNMLHKKKEFTWPQKGWLRLDDSPGMDRMYLILSIQRIYELEARFALSDKSFPESVLLDIRDRYQADDTSYRRQIEDDRVKVRFRSGNRPAVLIEEIALRHM